VADPLADVAVAEIASGMTVGRGIRALADRAREEGLDIQCVCTSESSEELAGDLGLNVIDFALVESVDYFFDGADEVDRELRVLKGSGGAMTRERMIAWASERVIYMVNAEKVVEHLGSNNTLGIAVMAFGLASIRAKLRQLGLCGVCRRTINGDLFITDNGNLILDVGLAPELNLEGIAAELNDIPGVIDHGLFLHEADEILIGRDGTIERLVRDADL